MLYYCFISQRHGKDIGTVPAANIMVKLPFTAMEAGVSLQFSGQKCPGFQQKPTGIERGICTVFSHLWVHISIIRK